jgi:hypothetical protein
MGGSRDWMEILEKSSGLGVSTFRKSGAKNLEKV